MASHLPFRAGTDILDVGCGPAWFWESAADHLPPAVTLMLTDLSSGMTREAEARCRDLPFRRVGARVADAAALPFEAESFDGVIAMHMLYHLPDPSVAVAEMYRVLRPGGFVALTTNGRNNMRRLYELTTAFGGLPYDPAASAFGFAEAGEALRERFGNVTAHRHLAQLHITSAEDVFLALTSYPPGSEATPDQLAAFGKAVEVAFAEEGGTLHDDKETGLFVAAKGIMAPLPMTE